MKLLLCSAGFYTEEIIKKTEELVGKKRSEVSVAVINEAYAVEHDNNLRFVLDDLNLVRDNFGGKNELVNLLALDIETVKQRIEKHDVIFVVGGNTDWLMRVFQKSGFDKLLPELLKTTVYVGSSAGSMIVGQRTSTNASNEIYGKAEDFGITKWLNFVDFAMMPHFGSAEFPGFDSDKLQKATKEYKDTVYGLSDDTAIVVEGDKTHFIGDKPIKIVDGELA